MPGISRVDGSDGIIGWRTLACAPVACDVKSRLGHSEITSVPSALTGRAASDAYDAVPKGQVKPARGSSPGHTVT